jgi:uncharacterized protein (TIRG00374 family)
MMSIQKLYFWIFKDKSLKAERIRRYAKLLIVLILFVMLFMMVPIENVVKALFSADQTNVIAGMVIGFISVGLTAAQLEPLTRNQGIKHGLIRILAINLAVKFYVNFLPTTLIASGYRWHRLSQPDGKMVESLAALGYFRVMETILNLALGILFFLLAGNSNGLRVSFISLAIILLAIVLGMLVITHYSLGIYRRFTFWADHYMKNESWRKISRQIEKLLIAISTFSNMSFWDLSLSFGAGILSAFSGIASGVFLARSVGINIDFMNMGWIQAVILFATQLPFTVAGGLGVREVTLVAILSTFGVSADQALALSFLIFFRGILLGLVGGLIEAVDALRMRKNVDTTSESTGRENPS